MEICMTDPRIINPEAELKRLRELMGEERFEAVVAACTGMDLGNDDSDSLSTRGRGEVGGHTQAVNSFLHYLTHRTGAGLKFQAAASHSAKVASACSNQPTDSDNEQILGEGFYVTAKEWKGLKKVEPAKLKEEFEKAFCSIGIATDFSLKVTDRGLWIGQNLIDALYEMSLLDAQSQSTQREQAYRQLPQMRHVNAYPDIFQSSHQLNALFIRNLAMGLGVDYDRKTEYGRR